MITRADIHYTEEFNENLSAEDIRSLYPDSLLMWISGSGSSPSRPFASYACVLDYKGRTKYIDGEVHGISSNAVMIEGFKACVENVKLPVNILLLTPCQLGFAGSFYGNGPNSARIQTAVELVKEKGCTLTSCVITGDVIKRFVVSQSGKKAKPRENKYRESIYRECIAKVCRLLADNEVEQDVIEQVRLISAEK